MSMSETDAAPDVPVAGDLLPGDRLSSIGDETTSAPVAAIDTDSGRVVPGGVSSLRPVAISSPSSSKAPGPHSSLAWGRPSFRWPLPSSWG